MRLKPATKPLWKQPVERRRGKKLKAGKKVNLWRAVRRELKVQFDNLNITTCQLRYEGCWVNGGLAFAHSMRRRFIGDDRVLLRQCILACSPCHFALDTKPHSETLAIVKRIRIESGLENI